MKKLISVALLVAMCVCLLAGCGSTNKAAEPVFKIGGTGPITGDAAIYGQAVMRGSQIAVDEINANGGINGVKVEFKFEDDLADGETAVNAYNKLMDWGMDVLVGPTTTGAAIAVSAKLGEERVFGLTPSASSPDVTAGKDNMFQLCFTDPNQGTGAATYMAGTALKDSKIAVIYRNDDAYSQGIRDTFATEAAAKGLNVVYEGTFTKDTATDFSVQLTGAQAAGADLVFLPIYYQPASVIFQQANAMGYAPLFMGVDGMDGILTLDGFDTSLAEGVVLLTPFAADAQDEVTKNFVAEFQKRYNEVPNQFAADAYDCVYAVKAAMEAGNVTTSMSSEEICKVLVEQFTKMSFDGLTGNGMTWGANGEVAKQPRAVVITDGVYVSA